VVCGTEAAVVAGLGRKFFFFEKKKQKLLLIGARFPGSTRK
jgi:hypothetical protein